MIIIIFKVVCIMLWGILYFVLIVMASFGFAVLMNGICKKLLYPLKMGRCAITVLPFSFDTSDMETSVSFFGKHMESGACHYVIILDCGLDEGSRHCAELLCKQYSNVLLCNGDDLYSTVTMLNNAVLQQNRS